MARKPNKKTGGSLELALEGGWHRPEGYDEARWRPPNLDDLPSSWEGVKRIGLDTETRDDEIQALGPGVRRGGHMTGISFAIEDGPKFYLPFAHGGLANAGSENYDNLEPDKVLGYFAHHFSTYTGEVVGMNLPYDLDYLWDAGIDMPCVSRYRDIGVADPLIYELHDYYSMASISKRWGFAGKDEAELTAFAERNRWHPKQDLWQMPARFVGAYGEEDAALPLKVLRLQEQKIAENELGACWDMQCRLLPILVRMTRRGVRVDVKRLDTVERWVDKVMRESLAIVQRETGVQIHNTDVNNTALLHKAMTVAGIDTSQGISRLVLGPLKDNATAQALDRAKQMEKIRNTYIKGTRKHLTGTPGNERIHCTFNQIKRSNDDSKGEESGVAFGRLSTEHVNMQNQPSLSRSPPNDETGAIWRSIFGPDPDCVWAAKDLKQQEPRWTYQFAAMAKLPGAAEVVQRLCENPLMDSYEVLVDITQLQRGTCKIAWLSYTYGKSDGNLCGTPPPFGFGLPTFMAVYDRQGRCHVPADSPRGLEIRQSDRDARPYRRPGPEGQAIIDSINKGAPFLKGLQQMAKQAANRGYVKLISGRRCHFEPTGLTDFRGNPTYRDAHAALNRIVQGSAAEQTAGMMLGIADAGYEDSLLLQVHDELDSQVQSEKHAREIVEVMKHAVPMMMPTVVDLEMGKSWGESMSVEYDEKGKHGKKCKVLFNWDTFIKENEL